MLNLCAIKGQTTCGVHILGVWIFNNTLREFNLAHYIFRNTNSAYEAKCLHPLSADRNSLTESNSKLACGATLWSLSKYSQRTGWLVSCIDFYRQCAPGQYDPILDGRGISLVWFVVVHISLISDYLLSLRLLTKEFSQPCTYKGLNRWRLSATRGKRPQFTSAEETHLRYRTCDGNGENESCDNKMHTQDQRRV